MKLQTTYLLIFLGWFSFMVGIKAQASGVAPVSNNQEISRELETSIKNNDEYGMAKAYYQLGVNFYNEGNYPISETYLLKAQALYTQLKHKSELALCSRKLAQVQEILNKKKKAIQNYTIASDNSQDTEGRMLNINDMSRMTTNNSVEKQERITDNLNYSLQQNNPTEVANSLHQMAEVNLQNREVEKAEKNLSQAYEYSKKENPQKALQYNQKLTHILVQNNKITEAIENKKNVLKESFVEENSSQKVEQLQELATLYSQNKEDLEAISLLQEAYTLSLEKGHTLEAQKSIQQLDSLYKKNGLNAKILPLYREFSKQLPHVIANDQSLVHQQVWKETEAKIQVLENEKSLKDDLIVQKNKVNYLLFGLLGIGLIGVIYLWYARNKLQIQNKKIALQSLSKEMNPHFIFNSLNSINQYIAQNDEKKANHYLTQFAHLMRSVLENSRKEFIPIEEEIELLQNYVSLEHQRFQSQFEYTFEVDENLLHQSYEIPVMLVQPFIENAIWHGLRYKKEKGKLFISFQKKQDQLQVRIQDNGIGIQQSEIQKTKHQQHQKKVGIRNIQERIDYLNELYHKKIQYQLQDGENGVQVILSIKL